MRCTIFALPLLAACSASAVVAPPPRAAAPRPAPVAEAPPIACADAPPPRFRLELAGTPDDAELSEPLVRRAMIGAADGVLDTAIDSTDPCARPSFGVLGRVVAVEESVGEDGEHRLRAVVSATLVADPHHRIVGRVDGAVTVASRRRPEAEQSLRGAFRSAFERLQSTMRDGRLGRSIAIPETL